MLKVLFFSIFFHGPIKAARPSAHTSPGPVRHVHSMVLEYSAEFMRMHAWIMS